MVDGRNEESELYLKNDVKAFDWAAKFLIYGLSINSSNL